MTLASGSSADSAAEATPGGASWVQASQASARADAGRVLPSQGRGQQDGGSAPVAGSAGSPVGAPWARRYARRLLLTDFFAILWACAGAHTVHLGTVSSRLSRNPLSPGFVALSAAVGIAWAVVLHLGGTREASVLGWGPDEYKRVIHSTITLFGLLAISSYVFDLDLPRAYVLVMMPAGLVALLVARFLWRRWLHVQRNAGNYQSKVLAVGNVRTVSDLLTSLRRAPLSGYQVIGVCAPAPRSDGTPSSQPPLAVPNVDGVPILGGLFDVAAVAKACGADVVAVTSTAAFGPQLVRKLGWELESTAIDLVLAPALTNVAGPRIHTAPVAGLPLLHVDRPTYRGASRILKKSFDLIGALLLLVLAMPLLVGLAVAIKLSDHGPVFFRQERVGLNGRSFKMIKFRSMVTNAEELLADLRKSNQDAGNEVMFKARNDPRVTRVGRFLRRFSLDELPQLFNVLAGDMSLVGPRPPLQAEVEMYADDAMLRLLVKPGMTGLWQVSGRSNLTWEETVRLDVFYVENWSITSDLVILWKTVKAVTASFGAY